MDCDVGTCFARGNTLNGLVYIRVDELHADALDFLGQLDDLETVDPATCVLNRMDFLLSFVRATEWFLVEAFAASQAARRKSLTRFKMPPVPTCPGCQPPSFSASASSQSQTAKNGPPPWDPDPAETGEFEFGQYSLPYPDDETGWQVSDTYNLSLKTPTNPAVFYWLEW